MNSAPRVWSRRSRAERPPRDAVYVGRPSPFGSPFTRERGETREQVIARFEAWLLSNHALTERVRRDLRGRHLVCWCAPKRCHADVLLRIANE